MTFETVKQFLEDVSILYPNKVYLGEDNVLKIDKAYPYRTIYITEADDGKRAVGDPELRWPEIEYIEENCQHWILDQMVKAKKFADAEVKKSEQLRSIVESMV